MSMPDESTESGHICTRETRANNATTTAGRVLRPVGGPGRSPNVHGIKINACYIGEIKDGVGERYTRNGVRGRAAGSKGWDEEQDGEVDGRGRSSMAATPIR